MNYGIMYKATDNFQLIGYSDSDWASCLDDRRSTTGNVFMLGTGPISRCSKKQNVPALSTTEAEYIATTSTACQAVWMRRLLNDIGMKQLEATPILCDNQFTIAIAKNPTHHGRTQHIDIKFHYIRELIVDEDIVLQYCSIAEQTANILTKAVSIHRFNYLRKKLGVQDLQLWGMLEIIEDQIETTVD